MIRSRVSSAIRTVARNIARTGFVWLRSDSVSYDGVKLPPRELRFGGRHFRANKDFLASARKEADRLTKQCGLTRSSSVVEVGCGAGRLPIGIIDRIGDIRSYEAFDVTLRCIIWCQQHISHGHPTFRFTHIDVANSRYNDLGSIRQQAYQFPVKSQSADIIYLYSVFSHLKEEDVRAYLREFKRILASDGTVFVTAFVEPNVPQECENPPGYNGIEWSGPLHCIRFERAFFTKLIEEFGFRVVREEYGTETDGQTAFYLKNLQ